MLITDASQLTMLKNIISPKSSANTTKTVPGWATQVLNATIDGVQAKTITSKKDSKEYTILEGLSNVGTIQLTIDEAKKFLTAKATKVVWKMSSSKTKEGDNYINLVIGDKPVGNVATTPPVEVEQDANPV